MNTNDSEHVVAYLVEAMCYKSEGRGFECQYGHLIVSNLPNPSSCTRRWGLLSL
jgi:hypothetical protein